MTRARAHERGGRSARRPRAWWGRRTAGPLQHGRPPMVLSRASLAAKPSRSLSRALASSIASFRTARESNTVVGRCSCATTTSRRSHPRFRSCWMGVETQTGQPCSPSSRGISTGFREADRRARLDRVMRGRGRRCPSPASTRKRLDDKALTARRDGRVGWTRDLERVN